MYRKVGKAAKADIRSLCRGDNGGVEQSGAFFGDFCFDKCMASFPDDWLPTIFSDNITNYDLLTK